MRQSAIAARRQNAARRRAARSLLWLVPAGAGALILGLQQAQRLDPPTWLIWASLLSGSVAVVANGAVDVVRAGEHGGTAYSASDRQKFLSGCAIEIQQELKIPATSIGVSLWAVYRPRRTLVQWARSVSRRPGDPARFLYRVERFRITDPGAIDEAWPEGRGIIGRCVESNDQTFRDYRSVQKKYPRDKPLSESQWKQICKADQDDGFVDTDFLRMVHRYEQVLALPIADTEGKVVGCISVDVTAEQGDPEPPEHPVLKRPQVVTIVHRTRESMRNTAMKYAVRP
jgi:hypothetical protein